MFVEDIKFPDGFEVKEMKEGNYYTIVSIENTEWEMRDMHIIIGIRTHGENCDTIICVGKDVDQLYGDKKEIIDMINHNVCSFFRTRAKYKSLDYRY